jgi:hypothetical protein
VATRTPVVSGGYTKPWGLIPRRRWMGRLWGSEPVCADGRVQWWSQVSALNAPSLTTRRSNIDSEQGSGQETAIKPVSGSHDGHR